MYFKTEGRTDARGAAVVGLNPGPAKDDERNYYLAQNCTYDAVISWMRDSGPKRGLRHRYHVQVKKLLNALNIHGPILWTELAKCENATGVRGPALQTFRKCTEAFLQHEIELLPEAWPLVGVGREVYNALAYRFPARTIIGVPHPTGSWGLFPKLVDYNGHLCNTVAKNAEDVLRTIGQSIWLSLNDSR